MANLRLHFDLTAGNFSRASARLTTALVLDTTISPPFLERAKAVTSRSIWAAFRTSIGLTSTPTDWRQGLDNGQLAYACRYSGVPHDRYLRHVRPNCFEQLQPFPAYAVFELQEACGVTAWPRQACNETGRVPRKTGAPAMVARKPFPEPEFFRFRLFATVALAHARGEQGTLSLRIVTLILR